MYEENEGFGKHCSLDILGVEDRGENELSDIHKEFKENIVRSKYGRHEVKIPWVPGSKIAESNKAQSRSRLKNVE